MKRLISICGILASSFSFGADWFLVAQSNDSNTNHLIDRNYYKYNPKSGTAEIWQLTRDYKGTSMERYDRSKTLSLYDCAGKRFKTLATVKYNQEGYVLESSSQPDKNFSIIFPDSVGESYWEAACKNKGKGLYLPVQREFLNMKRLQDNNILPKKE